MRRPALRLLAAVLPLLLLSGCATSFGYLWKQGGYLLHYSMGAKPIERLVKSSTTPPKLRDFLTSVEAIKNFAVDSIGLSPNRNYTTYKQLDRGYLVNVVQAAPPLELTAYEWRYPLLGALPYKGYYDPADARAEADRLRAQGYDVIVRRVDAFSTLGVLRDPVYSFMQRYSLYDLASVIIHEQTHATLFLKGQDQFNEELATYVGDQGALEFLAQRYGVASSEYRHAIEERHDNQLFLEFIGRVRQALSAVYAQPIPRAEKLDLKRATIAEYEHLYRTTYLPRFQTAQYKKAEPLPLNNAYLMLFGLYTRHIPLLARYDRLVAGGDLARFMVDMKRLARKPGEMFAKIDKVVSAKPRAH